MILEEPYYMTNEEWYYFDEKESRYKLTDKAPPEAIKSYEEYQELIKVWRNWQQKRIFC